MRSAFYIKALNGYTSEYVEIPIYRSRKVKSYLDFIFGFILGAMTVSLIFSLLIIVTGLQKEKTIFLPKACYFNTLNMLRSEKIQCKNWLKNYISNIGNDTLVFKSFDILEIKEHIKMPKHCIFITYRDYEIKEKKCYKWLISNDLTKNYII